MARIAEGLTEAINNEVSFVIPIFGGIPVSNSVVLTWIIMAIIIALSLIFTRNLSIKPTKAQMYLEIVIGGISNFIEGAVGEKGKRYIPYLGTVALYLGFANLSGLFGVKPPTKDLNITATLALMSIILVQVAAIRQKKVKGWLKGFTHPMVFMTPINIMEVMIRPLSLCMRLFGNILGGFIVMELIKLVVPIIVPVAFSFYFDIFDGLIQAYIFVFLTSIYINEAID